MAVSPCPLMGICYRDGNASRPRMDIIYDRVLYGLCSPSGTRDNNIDIRRNPYTDSRLSVSDDYCCNVMFNDLLIRDRTNRAFQALYDCGKEDGFHEAPERLTLFA